MSFEVKQPEFFWGLPCSCTLGETGKRALMCAPKISPHRAISIFGARFLGVGNGFFLGGGRRRNKGSHSVHIPLFWCISKIALCKTILGKNQKP